MRAPSQLVRASAGFEGPERTETGGMGSSVGGVRFGSSGSGPQWVRLVIQRGGV